MLFPYTIFKYLIKIIAFLSFLNEEGLPSLRTLFWPWGVNWFLLFERNFINKGYELPILSFLELNKSFFHLVFEHRTASQSLCDELSFMIVSITFQF